MKKHLLLLSLCLWASFNLSAQNTTKRTLKPSDVYRLKTISDAKISPEGNWVSYTLSTVDSAKNKRNADVYMVSWDGKETVQLTHTPEGESQARWSPDGKYLSFVSSRNGLTSGQIWLMDRRGGEAKQLTDLKVLRNHRDAW